jgi:hypothetical protein
MDYGHEDDIEISTDLYGKIIVSIAIRSRLSLSSLASVYPPQIQTETRDHFEVTPDHLLLDRSPNIEPLMSRWELDKFKNC